jgi:MFS family permease
MDFTTDRDTPARPENDPLSAPAESVAPIRQGPAADEWMRSANARIALLGVAGFLAAISWQVVIPFLPLHLQQTGFGPAEIGILASFLNLAMAIVELEVGRVAGVFGRRWTLVAGFFFNSVAMIWLAQTRTWQMVAVAIATVGAFRAMMWVPLFAEVAHTASAQTRGRTFGTFWFWTSVAFLIGPALGGLIVALHGTRAAFYVGSAFSVIALPALIAATDPSRPAIQVTVGGAARVLRIPAIPRLCMANLFYYSVTGIWMVFLPLYATQQRVPVLTIGYVFTLQGLTYALVQIPTGRLVDRLGPERLFIPAIVGRGILAALVPLLHTPFAFLLAGAAFGLAGGFLPVPLTTLMARLVPQEHYTTAMGVYNSSGDLGYFIGPLLGGAAALLGILAPFFLCVPLGLVGVVAGLSGMAGAQQAGASSL